MSNTFTPVIAGTRIGHVHLKVADLDRALGFYCGVLGFEVMQRYGDQAAFISAGGYHHHIGLNTWESKGGHPPAPGTTGCFTPRFCIRPARRLPTRCIACLRRALSSTAPATTASAKLCTYAIPTRTASSYTGIARKPNGRAIRMDRWRCSRASSIWRI